MPARLPANAGDLLRLTNEIYVCTSCFFNITRDATSRQTRHGSTRSFLQKAIRQSTPTVKPRRLNESKKGAHSARRYATNNSLASATAINAPSTVPTAYRELHQRLVALQESASSYVDQSRLQLAARSLEGESPIVRVALLGLGNNGALAARKLARVLLSDALSQEEDWERQLLDSVSDGRSLLLRYGDIEDAVQSSPLVQTMLIPSPYLRRHNVELLVTTLNTNVDSEFSSDSAALEEALLVPPLTIPNSAQGRVGFVRYPVHKAVVVAEGITGALEFGRYPVTLDKSLIKAALSVPLHPSTGVNSMEQEATGNAVDVDLAMHALNLFREDKANGAQFSDEWQISRMPALSAWIAGPKESDSVVELNPAVGDLISSLLSSASTSISVAEDAENALVTATIVPNAKRVELESAISTWAADAHRDLQYNLDTSFATSPAWRRTTWWRLFWRIDDVTISAAYVLRRSWLTEAEQGLAFISGRIFDSGLASEEQLRGPAPLPPSVTGEAQANEDAAIKDQPVSVADLIQEPSIISRLQSQNESSVLFNPPWPQTINLSRQYMIHTLVPDLHRKAQGFLATTVSTIAGSAALAAWFYVATAGIAVYESGAIAALGLVWGLRRLQSKWSNERDLFAVNVREDARRVLSEVQIQLRTIVRDGGRASLRPEDVQSWKEARGAVKRCREALEKVHSNG